MGAGQPAEWRVEYDLGGAVGNHLCRCRAGRAPVPGRGHDQEKDDDPSGRTEQLGLPAARSEAGERGERGPRSAPELAPPAEQCAGDAAAANAPVMPVASHAVAQNPGAGHAGALLPRAGVERKRRAVSGALLRSRCHSRCRTRRAVLGRRPCSTTSAADGSAGVGARARARAASRGSIGVAAHRFARAGIVPGGSVYGAVARPVVGRPAAAPATPARADRAGRRHEHPPGRGPAGRRRSRGGATARHAARRGARPLHLEGDHRSGVRTGTAPAEGSAVAPRPAHVVGRPGGAPGM